MAAEPEPEPEPAAMADPAMVPDPAMMRAATADRERVIDVLKAGFAEGRLSQAEHDERLAQVHAARTYGELASLVADLPSGPLGGAGCDLVTGYPPHRIPAPATINSLAVAALICGVAEFPTLGLTALPALILGNRAREQIHQTGERGEGLAAAGIVLGWVGLTVFFAIIAGIMVWLILPPGPGTGGPVGS